MVIERQHGPFNTTTMIDNKDGTYTIKYERFNFDLTPKYLTYFYYGLYSEAKTQFRRLLKFEPVTNPAP